MFATIRRGPFTVALVLLAGSAGLGALLAHDGVGADHSDLTSLPVGQSVQVKGFVVPFNPPPGPGNPVRWAPVLRHIANATYLLQDTPAELMVLVTSDAPHSLGVDPVVVTGVETMRIQHPDQPWRTLVLIHVTSWDEPLVFR